MPRPRVYSGTDARPAEGSLQEDACEPCFRSRRATASRPSPGTCQSLGVEIFATDGTREHLAADGVEVASITDLTGVPPMLGGQVKTFHPAVYAGILARRDDPEQLAELAEQGIATIDLVVVNVKSFGAEIGRQPRRHRRGDRDDRRRWRRAARGRCPQRRRRDRGRPARSTTRRSSQSSANAASSAPSSDPSSRPRPSAPWPPTTPRSRPTSTRSRGRRSRSASRWSSRRSTDLRYGENPHQRRRSIARPRTGPGRSPTHPAAGRPPVVQQPARPRRRLPDRPATTRRPTVVIAKHTDPVGIASSDELVEAYRQALETDPVASFGGIVGVNRELDGATAREIAAELVRGGRGARFRSRGARDPAPEARTRDPGRPAQPDRRDARLRHRQPRLQAHRRRPAGRDPRLPSASIAASSRW